jgi:hypothetical protein
MNILPQKEQCERKSPFATHSKLGLNNHQNPDRFAIKKIILFNYLFKLVSPK